MATAGRALIVANRTDPFGPRRCLMDVMRRVRGGAVRVLALLLLLGLNGCAARKAAPLPPPSPRADLGRARALLIAGCYTCLKDALDLYESVRKRFPDEVAAADGAALTALVLAVRERELGTLDSGFLDRARQLVPATSDPARFTTLAEIASGIPWSASARPREDDNRARIVTVMTNRAAWRDLLAAQAPTDPAIGYLAAAFDCAWGGRDAAPMGALAMENPAEPLLAFAKAICRGTDADPLKALLDREPRFIDAEYYIGLRMLGARQLDEADTRLTRALQYHAEWPALTLTLAGVAMTAEDTERSLALYDKTLAMVPGQQEARLGRVTALSYLGRFEDAIVMADGLIQEGRWYLGDSLYWRAWNKTQLARIEEAWADVSRALTLLYDDKTPKLAGLVAVRRTRYEEAQKLFETARSRNPADCDTKYYLAAVHAQLRHWPPSAELFAEATTCYEGTAVALRNEIERMSKSDATEERKDRIIAKRTKQMADAIREGETSCFNAAISYLNAGNKEQAGRYAGRAAQTEAYKDKAGELLARIEKMK